ncbi:MAG: family 78 glycoside hydrolase catalytic domain, partial [Christensenellaceae bacterium]
RPISVTESGAGYIYDFGQINAGLCRLKIDGKSGQTVDMTFGEVLQNGKLDLSNISFGDRSFEGYVQHDQYICRDGVQEYLPSFTYHGFRYVEVKGITKEQATKDLLEYVVIHSDIPPRGRFSCSDETVNRIQECALRSDTSNFYYFPTDCPQREKNGWTADASLSAESFV